MPAGGRDFEAAHLPVASFGPKERDQTLALFDKTELQLSAFAYYENNPHPDPGRREQIATHLRHAIDAAQMLGVSYVGTFIGRDPSRSVVANQHDAEKVFPPLSLSASRASDVDLEGAPRTRDSKNVEHPHCPGSEALLHSAPPICHTSR